LGGSINIRLIEKSPPRDVTPFLAGDVVVFALNDNWNIKKCDVEYEIACAGVSFDYFAVGTS
jgi:hypothetical protein